MNTRHVVLVLALVLVAAACSPGASSSTVQSADLEAAWRTTSVTDARTGESFTINGLQGKLVAIEPMAIWCSSCRIQQGEVALALDRLDNPDIVFVSVDVDPNERDGDLAVYADRSGFDWRFAVATADVARSLAKTFGDQILSPPSTPLILIGPEGEIIEQHFGIRRADDLVDLFAANAP
jgi:cytochrome oxidase Cu insertion factor (SCO1/SenC/PrrC family)